MGATWPCPRVQDSWGTGGSSYPPQLRKRRACERRLRLQRPAQHSENFVPQAAETFGNDSRWEALSTLKLILSRTIECEVLPSIQKLGMSPECSKPQSWNSRGGGGSAHPDWVGGAPLQELPHQRGHGEPTARWDGDSAEVRADRTLPSSSKQPHAEGPLETVQPPPPFTA